MLVNVALLSLHCKAGMLHANFLARVLEHCQRGCAGVEVGERGQVAAAPQVGLRHGAHGRQPAGRGAHACPNRGAHARQAVQAHPRCMLLAAQDSAVIETGSEQLHAYWEMLVVSLQVRHDTATEQQQVPHTLNAWQEQGFCWPVRVQVPTDGFQPTPGEPADEAPLTIGVSALMSYEHTGAVRLACERGCSCKPRCLQWFSAP